MRALIMSDLDGTLLYNHELSENKLSYINKWIKSGNDFGIATGRAPSECEKYINKIGYENIIAIYHNGNLIEIGGKKKINKYFSQTKLIKIRELLSAFDSLEETIFYGLYENYVYHPTLKLYKKLERMKTKYICNSNMKNDFILRILIFVTEKNRKIVDRLRNDAEIDIYINSNSTIDILPHSASKGNALKSILSLSNYSEVFVFGDSNNDLSMNIEEVKFVAVENSEIEILNCADIITCSNKYNIFDINETRKYLFC